MHLKKIEKVSGISSKDFTANFLTPGRPVILTDFVAPSSPAFQKWSYDYFREIAGTYQVQLFGKEDGSKDRAASAPVTKKTFREYLDLIESKPTDLRIFLFNLLKLKPDLLKDLQYNDVTNGKVLKWLPYLFFGGEGSSTRNHFDIDMSHVFLTQFKGTKRIWLFPLDQSPYLYKLPYNFHSLANIKEPNYEQFPALRRLEGFEAEISKGETLFMPSGYWHYIQYITEGYSISVRALPSNWMNKWRGFRNILITKNFDNTMRKLFKDKWFNYKIQIAQSRAKSALQKELVDPDAK